jgi:hypothetical protein
VIESTTTVDMRLRSWVLEVLRIRRTWEVEDRRLVESKHLRV